MKRSTSHSVSRINRLRHVNARGFTLLELIIAVTILASFVLPMLLILSKSKVRTFKVTQERQLRDLAQRKLFDHIHYYIDENEGSFEKRPEWTWEIPPPEPVNQGSEGQQVLLEYTIRVHTPQQIGQQADAMGGDAMGRDAMGGDDGEGFVYEMSVWTFPDGDWYLEQDDLFARGLPSILHGDPSYYNP